MDVRHLCRFGKVGAVIEEARIPISNAARSLASELQVSAEDLALHGGEDYVLLLAIAPDSFATASQVYEQAFGRPLYDIGSFSVDPQLVLKNSKGKLIHLPPRGYDHFRID
jgi:thiamine-monophosphate kinase